MRVAPGVDGRRSEQGFTLIELMVVVLIIAVLLAIAIPTFLAARQRANDRAAQSALRNSLTAAKAIYADKSTFLQADSTGLGAEEPSIHFTPDATTASAGPNEVSVSAGDTEWWAAAKSHSGTCFYITDSAGATGTRFWQSDTAPCSGATALANGTSFTGVVWAH